MSSSRGGAVARVAPSGNYALFLREMTDALGLDAPEPADTDSTYRFEYPVRGDHGPPLRIDLYKKGAFILEAKQSRLAENVYRRHDKGEVIVQPDLFGEVGHPKLPSPAAAPGSPT
ncbi:MAG: restriction endonuclease subunit [Caulobacteraceae bacterium]|jgi:hypothetical protein|nr:restriction endonuclease subunit [Caulobacteraceae bacterium]